MDSETQKTNLEERISKDAEELLRTSTKSKSSDIIFEPHNDNLGSCGGPTIRLPDYVDMDSRAVVYKEGSSKIRVRRYHFMNALWTDILKKNIDKYEIATMNRILNKVNNKEKEQDEEQGYDLIPKEPVDERADDYLLVIEALEELLKKNARDAASERGAISDSNNIKRMDKTREVLNHYRKLFSQWSEKSNTAERASSIDDLF